MSEKFETHLAAGNAAWEERDHDAAAPAFQAALAAAENGLERALALIGLARPDCYLGDRARALKLLDEARAGLPSLDPPEPRLADAYASICLRKSDCLMGLRQYDHCIQELDLALDRFLDFASAPEPRDPFAHQLRKTIIEVLQMKAGLISQTSRATEVIAYDKAIACYDELIRRFRAVSDPTIMRRVAWAMLVRAWKLPHADRASEEMAAYAEIIARYGDRTEEKFVEIVTAALEHQIELHEKNDNPIEALAAAEDILHRSTGHTDWTIARRAGHARLSKAYALIALDRMDEGRALCDQIIADQADDWIGRVTVASALLIKADSYLDADIASAIACYDRVIGDYGDDTDTSVKRQVCRIMLCKSQVLRDAGREEEAVECLKAIIGEYGDHRDPRVKDMIEEARTMLKDGPATSH